MIRLIGLIALLALAVPAQSAPATVVPDLFMAEVPVDGEDEKSRQRAARAALARVMVRVSGDRSIAERSGSEAILQQASAFLQRFQYRRSESPDGPRQFMKGFFDRQAVTEALKRYGLPVWSERRAVTLVWFAAQNAEGVRQLLDQDMARQQVPALFELAAARGTPLAFPLYDIEDQNAIDFADIWGNFRSRVDAASARYDVHHVLLVRLEQDGAQWVCRLTALAQGRDASNWSFAAALPDQALAAAYSAYADSLAQRYVVRSGDGWLQDIELQVTGIRDLRTHGRVLEHLQSLGAVDAVRIVEVTADHNVFAIRFEGDLSGLEQAIELGRVLKPAEAVAPVVARDMSFFVMTARPRLHYRVR